MTRAIDPFEEFLRKKKVELLEKQYREQGDRASETETAVEERQVAADPDDVEQDARVKAEMDEFFESGQKAGVELFEQMQGIDENKVEEIKDALSDVFEEDTARPPTSEDSDTFVNFFQQVQDNFDEGKPPATAPSTLPHAPNASIGTAVETPAAPAAPAPAATPPPAPPVTAPVVSAPLQDIQAAAAEVSTDHPDLAAPTRPLEGRINLAEILLSKMDDADDLGKRIEVLFRLVARLVERSGVPESEIIEALIKSDVEF